MITLRKKRDQEGRKLRIWSHLQKKSLMEIFIFCAVLVNFRTNQEIRLSLVILGISQFMLIQCI